MFILDDSVPDGTIINNNEFYINRTIPFVGTITGSEVTITAYPDLVQLFYRYTELRRASILFAADISMPEGNQSEIYKIKTAENIRVSGFSQLHEIGGIGDKVIDIAFENCPRLTFICPNKIGTLTMLGDIRKTILVMTNHILDIKVDDPKKKIVDLCIDSRGTLPVLLLGIKSIEVRFRARGDAIIGPEISRTALNVAHLQLDGYPGQIIYLDDFNLNRVTKLTLKHVNIECESLPKLISWTSHLLSKKMPSCPKLRFTIINGTEEDVLDNYEYYLEAVQNRSAKFYFAGYYREKQLYDHGKILDCIEQAQSKSARKD